MALAMALAMAMAMALALVMSLVMAMVMAMALALAMALAMAMALVMSLVMALAMALALAMAMAMAMAMALAMAMAMAELNNLNQMKQIITTRPPEYDSNDVRWESDKSFSKGHGYQNRETKHIGLILCPKCSRENYAMAVSSGICSWCGFDANNLK